MSRKSTAHAGAPTPPKFTGFRPAALSFFTGLARHNTKPWFEARRDVYEGEVLGPMRALVATLDVRLATVAPEFVGDPKRAIFRIYRDTRFSKDKSPYKTAAAFHITHRDLAHSKSAAGNARDVGGGAGFYFHLQPEQCFVGGGMWQPPPLALRKVRGALLDDPGAFAATLEGTFRRRFRQLSDEDRLARLPRGYPAGHPAEPWLRFRSFTAGRRLSTAEVLSARLTDTLMKDFTALLPLVRWLNAAIGYRPATRR